MRNSFILTGENLTFVVNGKTYTLSKTKKIYAEARQLIIDGDYDAAVTLYNSQEEVKKEIEKPFIKLKVDGIYRAQKIIKNDFVVGAVVWCFEFRKSIISRGGTAHFIGDEFSNSGTIKRRSFNQRAGLRYTRFTL